MPSARRQKTKARPASRPARPPARKAPPKKTVHAPAKKPTAGATSRPSPKSGAATAATAPVVRRPDGRVHLLSLSFVRDGDEFLARMETDGGQITELKNRALDQLLTLVASELEDLLE